MRNPGGALTPTGKDTANRKGTAMSNNENTTEVWKPIPGWEGHYEASTHGRVRSVKRPNSPRILKERENKNGYLEVTLSDRSRQRWVTTHVLVLETFKGFRQDGEETRHLDGTRKNNHISNLEWSSHTVNMRDRLKHGTHPQLNKTHCPRGHEHTLANNVKGNAKRGKRSCLACARAIAYVRYHPELKDNIQEISDSYYAKIMPNHSAG